jgi:hypothetical protein
MNMKTTIIIIVLALAVGALVAVQVRDWKNTMNIPGNGISTTTGNTTPTSTSVTLEYKNDQYGFTFSLPKTWTGYTIINSTWVGYEAGKGGDDKYTEGHEISIRHPLWTAAVPRQDIPIMVFTLSQWNDLQNDKFHIGAAPIGPSELGRNANYVFAIPARYNFAFPVGYEEVDQILQGKPLHAY